MALLHHATKPAANGGMSLAHVLTAATPASGGGVTLGADVMSCNLHLLPARQFPVIGLYVTQGGGGSGFIAATQAQLAEYPDCVKYAQLPTRDPLWADVLDFEAGAATAAELVDWAKGALESFHNGDRPGQRMPAVYFSASNVHTVVNTLTDAGVKSGVGLIIANWNLTSAQAQTEVIARSGPFPIVGIQYADAGAWDLDVWATAWLNTRSAKSTPVKSTPVKPAAGYGPPLNLKATGGHTTVQLTWQPPGTEGLPDPADYEVAIYTTESCTRTSVLPSWAPRHSGGATEIEGGSLGRGRTYWARVIAAGPNGTLVRPNTHASVKFTTG